MSKKRIFITGGSGFIGSHLVRKWIGEEVHLLLKPDSDLWRLEEIKEHLFFHRGSLENGSFLTALVKEIQPNAIFHLAAHGASPLHRDANALFTSNVIGTFNLLNAIKDIDFDSFIHVGGSSEYGKKTEPMKETDLLEPATFYGTTKACASLLVQQFAKAEKRPIAIARLFSIYGPLEPRRRLIPCAIDAALSGKTLPMTPPSYVRDFLFVADAIDGISLLSKKPLIGEIFNFGTGIQTSNEGVLTLVEELTHRKISRLEGAYSPHPSDHPFWTADIEKTKTAFGWTPPHSLKMGLQKTITWMQNDQRYYSCLSK